MKQAARVQPTEGDSPSPPVEAMEVLLPMTASPSPARELQRRLQLSLPAVAQADGVAVDAWPLYMRASFIVLTAASLWVAIIASVRAGLV